MFVKRIIFVGFVLQIVLQTEAVDVEPPAVNEKTEERHITTLFSTDIVQHPMNMKMYLTRNRRQNDQMGTMDSYIEAYKLSHESYQSKQEEDTSRIAEENEKIMSSRSKREAAADPPHEKDFIKFELTDAIQPDADTLKNRKTATGKNLRLPYEIADTVYGNKTKNVEITKPNLSLTSTTEAPKANTTTTAKSQRTRRRRVRKDGATTEAPSSTKIKRDGSNDGKTSESRKIKVYVTAPETRHPEGGIPLSVQKAINMVLNKSAKNRVTKLKQTNKQQQIKKENEKFTFYEKNPKTRETPKATSFSDVKTTSFTEVSSDEWKPISAMGSLGRYPSFNSDKAPDYLTFVPVKNYKTVVYGKPLSEQQLQQTHAPIVTTPTPSVITKYVPVPQIQYIIKEIPVLPYNNVPEPPKISLTPNIKISYDEKDDVSEIKISPTSASISGTKPSFSKYISSITNTKTFIDHNDGVKPKDNNFKLDALTALIGKSPEYQLKGLNNILDSKENKSPLLFHPNGVKPPEPLNKFNIKVLDFPDDKSKLEPISIEEFNRLYGGENNYKISTDEYNFPRPFTPIHEQHDYEYSSVTVAPTTAATSLRPLSSLNLNKPMTHHDHKAGISAGYEEDSETAYGFGYRVRDYYTGNDFGHTQNKNQDGKITGEYHILLPDGRVQNVRYHADNAGFHADVTYEGPQS